MELTKAAVGKADPPAPPKKNQVRKFFDIREQAPWEMADKKSGQKDAAVQENEKCVLVCPQCHHHKDCHPGLKTSQVSGLSRSPFILFIFC